MYDPTRTHGHTASLWYRQLSAEADLQLVGDGQLTQSSVQADVAIIGAGIAGLSVAYHLCQTGRSVIVLDKGLIGSGETGRTTAHIASALDDRYTAIERIHGRSGAQLAAASHQAAIADIERIVATEHIACELEQVPGYLESVAESDQDACDELTREAEAALRAGVPVLLNRAPASPWTRGWHLQFEHQAQFQPLAYLLGLAAAIRRSGGRIFTRTRVTGVDELASPCIVRVDGEHRIFARDVVVATTSLAGNGHRPCSKS